MLGLYDDRYRKSWFALLFTICFISKIDAQEVSFTPRFDTVEDSAIESHNDGSQVGLEAHLYSFGRFRSEIDLVCAGLDGDKRTNRLVEISAEGSRVKGLTPTYRALLNEIASRCSATIRSSKGTGQNRSVASSLFDVPYPSRWPSTETLDATSRLGAALYSYDKDTGTIFVALHRFSSLVLSYRGLSRGEIDYYGTFFKFLQGAWIGRNYTDRYQRLANREDSAILFNDNS